MAAILQPGLLDNLRYEAMGMAPRFVGAQEPAGGLLLETDTAVLLLLVVGFLWLAREVALLRKRVGGAAGAPAAPASAAAAPGIPPEHRAAIAAAVYVVCGRRVRVAAITARQELLWSREGRRQVLESHRVR